MKKLFAILTALVTLFACAACAQTKPAEPGSTGAPDGGAVSAADGAAEEIVVAYIAKNTIDPFVGVLNEGMQNGLDGLKKDGVISDWQFFDAQSDPMIQCNLLEDAINNGCNFVVVAPAETEGSAPIVTRCKELGIPCVLLNSVTNNADQATVYVGSNDVEAGEMMGKYVQSQFPEGGGYAYMMGVIGNSAQIDRGQGVENILGADEKWTALNFYPAEWMAEKAVQFASDAITQYGGSLNAIVCDNDEMAAAVQAYCNSVDRGDIVSIGVDGNPGPMNMIQSGELRSTVLQDGRGQAAAAVSVIRDYVAGKEISDVIVPFVLITKDNVEDYIK